MMKRFSWASCALLAFAVLPQNHLLAQTPVTVTYSYSGLPLPILSDAANVITLANVFVPQAIKTTKIAVRVKIDYPNSGDLKLYLFSPIGTRIILLEHDCGVQNIDTTFDDAATSTWKDFCPVEAGRGPFRADQPLSNAYGDDSAFGTWTLSMENDRSDSRSGWLNEFALTITGTGQTSPVFRAETFRNAANVNAGGSLAPGEMISVYGVGLGPVAGVEAPVGALPTTLGGASVTFGGVAAPIAYASYYRLDIQAPFNLVAGTKTSVQVRNNANSSPSYDVDVTAAIPGVYANGFNGQGQIQAVNQDGTLNGAVSRAAKGSYITIYASGLGAVSPALTAGAVPPLSPLSTTVNTVGAAIGGIPATVQFAGAAPGYPGLYQVNVQVPLTAVSGSQELVLYVNSKTSQSGATVMIQ